MDYEIVSTIRNERWRTKMNVFEHRLFEVAGGWSTFAMQYWSAGFTFWLAGGNVFFLKQCLSMNFI